MDIKKEIEYLENQVSYLDRYHEAIVKEWKKTKSFKVKWEGLNDDHIIYLQLDRWIVCYADIKTYLQKKEIHDADILAHIHALPQIQYQKITPYYMENLNKGKKLLQKLIFPLRLNHNLKKIKAFQTDIQLIGDTVYQLKKIRYNLESYYLN